MIAPNGENADGKASQRQLAWNLAAIAAAAFEASCAMCQGSCAAGNGKFQLENQLRLSKKTPCEPCQILPAEQQTGLIAVAYPLFSLLLALTLVLLGQVPFTFAGQSESFPKVMKVGFSAGVFPDVDQRDLQAAMQLWTKQLARGTGDQRRAETISYNIRKTCLPR